MKLLSKLFGRKKLVSKGLPKIGGFYIDKNTIGEQSRTGWSELIRDATGEIIEVRGTPGVQGKSGVVGTPGVQGRNHPLFPPDRKEIH
jgi:hypothetical protein